MNCAVCCSASQVRAGRRRCCRRRGASAPRAAAVRSTPPPPAPGRSTHRTATPAAHACNVCGRHRETRSELPCQERVVAQHQVGRHHLRQAGDRHRSAPARGLQVISPACRIRRVLPLPSGRPRETTRASHPGTTAVSLADAVEARRRARAPCARSARSDGPEEDPSFAPYADAQSRGEDERRAPARRATQIMLRRRRRSRALLLNVR